MIHGLPASEAENGVIVRIHYADYRNPVVGNSEIPDCGQLVYWGHDSFLAGRMPAAKRL